MRDSLFRRHPGSIVRDTCHAAREDQGPHRGAAPARARGPGHARAADPSTSGIYVDEQADHPLALAGRAVLEPRGESEALQQRMLAIYAAGNEDPDAFWVTSRYVIATARRAG